jgi:hypothetical protein
MVQKARRAQSRDVSGRNKKRSLAATEKTVNEIAKPAPTSSKSPPHSRRNSNEKAIYLNHSRRCGGTLPDGRPGSQKGPEHFLFSDRRDQNQKGQEGQESKERRRFHGDQRDHQHVTKVKLKIVKKHIK